MDDLRPRGLDPSTPRASRAVSLAEVLDRVLNKGAVVSGEVVISVAGIELVYLGLNVVLTSIQTARECVLESSEGAQRDPH
jgi:hypothetical protein